jgi:hypothetical protein
MSTVELFFGLESRCADLDRTNPNQVLEAVIQGLESSVYVEGIPRQTWFQLSKLNLNLSLCARSASENLNKAQSASSLLSISMPDMNLRLNETSFRTLQSHLLELQTVSKDILLTKVDVPPTYSSFMALRSLLSWNLARHFSKCQLVVALDRLTMDFDMHERLAFSPCLFADEIALETTVTYSASKVDISVVKEKVTTLLQAKNASIDLLPNSKVAKAPQGPAALTLHGLSIPLLLTSIIGSRRSYNSAGRFTSTVQKNTATAELNVDGIVEVRLDNDKALLLRRMDHYLRSVVHSSFTSKTSILSSLSVSMRTLRVLCSKRAHTVEPFIHLEISNFYCIFSHDSKDDAQGVSGSCSSLVVYDDSGSAIFRPKTDASSLKEDGNGSMLEFQFLTSASPAIFCRNTVCIYNYSVTLDLLDFFDAILRPLSFHNSSSHNLSSNNLKSFKIDNSHPSVFFLDFTFRIQGDDDESAVEFKWKEATCIFPLHGFLQNRQMDHGDFSKESTKTGKGSVRYLNNNIVPSTLQMSFKQVDGLVKICPRKMYRNAPQENESISNSDSSSDSEDSGSSSSAKENEFFYQKRPSSSKSRPQQLVVHRFLSCNFLDIQSHVVDRTIDIQVESARLVLMQIDVDILVRCFNAFFYAPYDAAAKSQHLSRVFIKCKRSEWIILEDPVSFQVAPVPWFQGRLLSNKIEWNVQPTPELRWSCKQLDAVHPSSLLMPNVNVIKLRREAFKLSLDFSNPVFCLHSSSKSISYALALSVRPANSSAPAMSVELTLSQPSVTISKIKYDVDFICRMANFFASWLMEINCVHRNRQTFVGPVDPEVHPPTLIFVSVKEGLAVLRSDAKSDLSKSAQAREPTFVKLSFSMKLKLSPMKHERLFRLSISSLCIIEGKSSLVKVMTQPDSASTRGVYGDVAAELLLSHKDGNASVFTYCSVDPSLGATPGKTGPALLSVEIQGQNCISCNLSGNCSRFHYHLSRLTDVVIYTAEALCSETPQTNFAACDSKRSLMVWYRMLAAQDEGLRFHADISSVMLSLNDSISPINLPLFRLTLEKIFIRLRLPLPFAAPVCCEAILPELPVAPSDQRQPTLQVSLRLCLDVYDMILDRWSPAMEQAQLQGSLTFDPLKRDKNLDSSSGSTSMQMHDWLLSLRSTSPLNFIVSKVFLGQSMRILEQSQERKECQKEEKFSKFKLRNLCGQSLRLGFNQSHRDVHSVEVPAFATLPVPCERGDFIDLEFDIDQSHGVIAFKKIKLDAKAKYFLSYDIGTSQSAQSSLQICRLICTVVYEHPYYVIEITSCLQIHNKTDIEIELSLEGRSDAVAALTMESMAYNFYYKVKVQPDAIIHIPFYFLGEGRITFKPLSHLVYASDPHIAVDCSTGCVPEFLPGFHQPIHEIGVDLSNSSSAHASGLNQPSVVAHQEKEKEKENTAGFFDSWTNKSDKHQQPAAYPISSSHCLLLSTKVGHGGECINISLINFFLTTYETCYFIKVFCNLSFVTIT